MHPFIGLNMSIRPPAGAVTGEALAPLAYIDAIEGASGIPFCIPPYEDHGKIRKILPFLSGFLFIGGADYQPVHYGGHPQPEEELIHPRRDTFDIALARIILDETELPVLGVCGGHQLLAIARGGALIQDIDTEWRPPGGRRPLPHSQKDRERQEGMNRIANGPRVAPGKENPSLTGDREKAPSFRHDVSFNHHSLAARATGTPPGIPLSANSFHHQAVHPDRIGQDFIASAWSADGVIEAIEPAPGSPWAANGRFILGVQWHPERMQDEEPQRRLFQAFVHAASRKRHFS